ncbi:MAG: alpha-E domain-containing protein [Pseudomonadota bacterium]|nr:alpha-E domain-containing protein [Pseudomonadota bacterium]
MTLLLSTAYNLYWLGRYMRRTQELLRTATQIAPPQRQQVLAAVGVVLDDMGDDKVLAHLAETALPDLFHRINDNVQAVRAVIDADASELFNQVRRLYQAGSPRAAVFQLSACAAVMLEQRPLITQFWQLGDYVEMLDQRIRLGSAESRHYRYLAQVVTQLPPGTGWDRIKQQIQALVFTTQHSEFHDWRQRLDQLFEDGV